MLGAGILAAPFVAEAQPAAKVPRIGYLTTGPAPTPNRPPHVYTRAFLQSLRDLGWVEGRNIIIDYRGAAGDVSRFAGLAEELVALKVDVIVATTNVGTVAASKATKSIPIVQASGIDPVVLGLAKSLARPGGNVTGVTANVGPEIDAKRLQFLREAVPALSRLALLRWPGDPGGSHAWAPLDDTARMVNIRLRPFDLRSSGDLEGIFALAKQERHDALIVWGDALLFQHRQSIVELAARHRIPASYAMKDYVHLGGLMSYGANFEDLFRQAAWYVDRILKGADPAGLPFAQPTKFEQVINLKTAKALGLTIPPSLLLRADEVIE